MDFKSIQELLRMVSKSELTEVEIEQKDFKIRMVRKAPDQIMMASPVMQAAPVSAQMMQPVVQQQAVAPIAQPVANEVPAADGNVVPFKSPMIGTFYRSPGPDKEAFVKVGDMVRKGQVLCIIEAMKLFNEIESELDGKIVKILVDNSSPVEYDQPLFLIEKA